jgi:hypothetical protein
MLKIALILSAVLSAAVDLVNMPANSWVQIPNSTIRSVAASASQYPAIQAVEGVAAVINDWCGGTFDTRRNRLIIHGGGHNGYYGNEIYGFDVGTQTWSMLKAPTANPTMCTGEYSDGTPASRHTYGGMVYMSGPDRMFICGGCPACPAGGCGMPATWTFNFANTTWQKMSPSGSAPVTCCDDVAAYDSATNKVYFLDIRGSCGGYSNAGLFAYSYTSNAWTRLNSDVLNNAGAAMAIDTRRHTLIVVQGGSVFAYNLDNPTAAHQTWTTTGGGTFINQGAQGLAYDPVSDKFVGWKGGAVWVLDPVTKAWTSHNPSGGPPSNVAGVTNGVYNRWQYVPSVNAFVTVVSVDGNVYFYKLTAGMGIARERQPVKKIPAVEVSPNPVSDRAVIRVSGKALISIYDLRGKKVHEAFTEGRAYEWDATAVPCGIYTVRSVRAGRTSAARLLVRK